MSSASCANAAAARAAYETQTNTHISFFVAATLFVQFCIDSCPYNPNVRCQASMLMDFGIHQHSAINQCIRTAGYVHRRRDIPLDSGGSSGAVKLHPTLKLRLVSSELLTPGLSQLAVVYDRKLDNRVAGPAKQIEFAKV